MRTKAFVFPMLATMFTLALVALGAGLLPCTSVAQDAPVIRLGAILPLSGGAASSGVWYQRGFEMGVDDVNASGGVDGIKFKAVFEDHQTQPAPAVTAFRKLVSVDKAPVVSLSWSSPTLAVLPIADQTGTLVLVGAANSPRLINAGKYLLANLANAAFEAEVGLRYVSKVLRLQKVAIVYRNDDFGNGMREQVEPMWKQMGGTVVAVEGHDPTAQDFTSLVAKIKAANPQFIYMASSASNQGILVKQLREGGVAQQIVSYLGFEVPEILSVAGNAAEGALYTTSSNPLGSPAFEEYRARFKQRYGAEPVNFANLQYEIVQHVARATRTLKDRGLAFTGKNYRDVFLEIREFDGILGKTKYRDDGSSVRPQDLKTVKGGKFVVSLSARELQDKGVIDFGIK
jgi:branched-chain amino acid transport system substrate-binding protein